MAAHRRVRLIAGLGVMLRTRMLLHQEFLRRSAICGGDPFKEIVLELGVVHERFEIPTRS